MRPVRKREEEAEPQALEPAMAEATLPSAETPSVSAPTHTVIKPSAITYKPGQLEAIRKDALDAYLDERERIEAERKKKKRRDEEILLLM